MSRGRQADYLFELGCEELPADTVIRAQRLWQGRAAELLDERRLEHESVQCFATPRRLGLCIRALAGVQSEQVQERRGPSLEKAYDAEGAPTPALLGFARSAGVEDLHQLRRVETPKGVWLYADIRRPGRPAAQLLPEIIAVLLREVAQGRTMRWSGAESFVRPVRWVVSVYGSRLLPLRLFGVEAGRRTRGHRVHGSRALSVNAGNYLEKLREGGGVVADFDARQKIIRRQIAGIAKKLQLTPYDDAALLDEITALCEWPVAIQGEFPKEYLKVPAEVLIASMQQHQKYIALKKRGRLANRFIAISNLKSLDAAEVVAGNERVLRPRLADARFFYEKDLERDLDSYGDELAKVNFHPRLGSLADKTERLAAWVDLLGRLLGTAVEADDIAEAERAARLCKADLLSHLVGEFPQLQGYAGSVYARVQGHSEAVCSAIAHQYCHEYRHKLEDVAKNKDRYRPAALLLSLADKLDNIVGLLAAGEKASGSRDPFALRRDAQAVWGICQNLPLAYSDLLEEKSLRAIYKDTPLDIDDGVRGEIRSLLRQPIESWHREQRPDDADLNADWVLESDQPQEIRMRMQMLKFAGQTKSLKALYAPWEAARKRTANILRGSKNIQWSDKLSAPEKPGKSLIKTLRKTAKNIEREKRRAPGLDKKNLGDFLKRFEDLNQSVEQYFDAVLINDGDPELRRARLSLIKQVNAQYEQLTDFSQAAAPPPPAKKTAAKRRQPRA